MSIETATPTDVRDVAEPELSPRERGLLRALQQMDGKVLLVLEERMQDIQSIYTDERGLPPATEAQIARCEMVIIEQQERLACESVRYFGAGVLECRVRARDAGGAEITMIQYVPLSSVRRFAVRSTLDLEIADRTPSILER